MHRRHPLSEWRALSKVVVVDLECTCADDGSIPPDRMETIEIGATLVALPTGAELASFQTFVRPVERPSLSEFCLGLTHIRQEDVDRAPPLPEALAGLLAFLETAGVPAFVSWGAFDHLHLRREAKRKRVPYGLTDHFNAKAAFRERFDLATEISLERALDFAGLAFEGEPHRALVDARNTARLLAKVLEPGAGAPSALATRARPGNDSAEMASSSDGDGTRV